MRSMLFGVQFVPDVARIQALLEQLPPTPAVTALRRELQRQVDRAMAQRDDAELLRLHREIKALAKSLGVGSDGKIDKAKHQLVQHGHPSTGQHAGPGLPGWGRRAVSHRVGYSSPAREHAPLAYPYGDPPVSRNHGHVSDWVRSRRNPGREQMVDALVRHWRIVADQEDEARERMHRHYPEIGVDE